MAVRAHRHLQNALIRSFKVAASTDVTLGKRVKFASADDEVSNCAAGENGIGVAYETENDDGDRVQVVLDGHAIVPVLVGTGGATRGAFAVAVSDGWTDQTLGGGTTVKHVGGKFLQSGVAGDYVGMMVGCVVSGVA